MHGGTHVGLSSWIAHKSVWSPQNVAIRFGSREITYAIFERRIAHLAGYLAARQGVRTGDRVAYLGPNAPELLDLFFACARIGAIFVPLNSRMTAKQIAILLTNCSPRCMFVHLSFRATAEACQDAIDGLRLVPFADDPAAIDDSLLDVDKLTATERPVACKPSADQNIPVLIAYTSGTTGVPKGALYTQDAITFSAINSNTSFNMRSRDHVLTFLPMFHVGGLLIQTLPAFHVGATVTIHRAFDAGEVLGEIHERGVTLILPPPAMSKALSSHPLWPKTNLRSIRCVAIGSTIVPPEIMQPWFDLNVPTQQLYGLTEGVPVLAAPWEHARRKSRAVGTPVLYCEARVADQNFRPQPAGTHGEIVLRGRNLFKEYWENPEATRAAFVDGWFRTGDVGYTDPQGYFYVVDRIKNIVIVGSSNVYPIDLEVVLAECNEIEEAAVVGCPDADTGEALVACVVLKSGGRMTEAQVKALFRGRLAEYQHPRHVLFMDSLPKTSLGKVQKSELTNLAARQVGDGRR
jgi:fatty-acyl-CoA synthase